MKKTFKSFISVIISLALIISPLISANCYSDNNSYESSYKFAHALDKVLDTVLDTAINGLFNALFNADSLLKSKAFPTEDEYFSEEHPFFYKGTNGCETGEGWELGYAQASVLPDSWRVDSEGKKDPEGMNLNKKYYFGGYFTSTTDRIYDDETINLAILSTGSDNNNNGKNDIIVIAALDNIGMSNGNVRKVREAIAESLKKNGLEDADIRAIEFNCTHTHSVIEALGMSMDSVFLTALKNHITKNKDAAVKKELFDTICKAASECTDKAYKNMKSGNLYYFETENLDTYMKENCVDTEDKENVVVARDKLGYGADCQKEIACWYFESEDGEKTVLANIGMHPTLAGRNSGRVCADFPYYFNLAMQEMGYNLIFIQGSQAAIGTSVHYTQNGKDWAERNALSKDEWISRYGQKYADKKYEEEKDYFNMRAFGYSLAEAVTGSIQNKEAVDPSINIKMSEAVIPFDYSIMYIAGVSSAFNYNVIKYPESETGYAFVTEIGYMQLGAKTVMLMLPGEVSPAITFGKADTYNGTDSWSGENSWSGETYTYDTIEKMAHNCLGTDKKILAMGLANDEVGYVMPETDTARNFLTKSILSDYGYQFGRANNEELMMASQSTGSALAEAFEKLFDSKVLTNG